MEDKDRRWYERRIADVTADYERKLAAAYKADPATKDPDGMSDGEDEPGDGCDDEADLGALSNDRLDACIAQRQSLADAVEKGGDTGPAGAAILATARETLARLREEKRRRKPGHVQLADLRRKLDRKDAAIRRAETQQEEMDRKVRDLLAEQQEKMDELNRLRMDRDKLQTEFSAACAKTTAEAVGAEPKELDANETALSAALSALGLEQAGEDFRRRMRELVVDGKRGGGERGAAPEPQPDPPGHIHTPHKKVPEADGRRETLQRDAARPVGEEATYATVASRGGPGSVRNARPTCEFGDGRSRTRSGGEAHDDSENDSENDTADEADQARAAERRRGMEFAPAQRRSRRNQKSRPPAGRS